MAPVESDIYQWVTDAFRQASWRIQRPRSGGRLQHDLTVEGGGRKYAVQIKRSSEGRRDRVIPLLSQAILEAQSFAKEVGEPTVPVAVVGAPRIAPAVVDAVQQFLQLTAPDVGTGIVDGDGMRVFWGHGLEVLNRQPSPKRRRDIPKAIGPRLPRLFSDLNQWMLKLLLAEAIPEQFLSAPRAQYRNATELARAAGVSLMSASRLLQQLEKDGFVDLSEEPLQLVRIPDLLSRWSAWRDRFQEFPVRWLVKQDRSALGAVLKSYSAEIASAGRSATDRGRQPRVCLGLFAAADALGFGFVHGVPPHVYMDRFGLGVLQRLGLSVEGAEHNPDAIVRVPGNPESVFRASVVKDGVPCADILQVWLDVSDHPSRGRVQADEIARRALGPLLRKK
jgi:hypothetical protein